MANFPGLILASNGAILTPTEHLGSVTFYSTMKPKGVTLHLALLSSHTESWLIQDPHLQGEFSSSPPLLVSSPSGPLTDFTQISLHGMGPKPPDNRL